MKQAIENNFVEFLVVSMFCLLIISFAIGMNVHSKMEMEHELEMAKVGCVERFGPGGYNYWECNKKEEQHGP